MLNINDGDKNTFSVLSKIKIPRVVTPTVIQMEAVECGAACLKMILDYFGLYIPLERLRIDCGVSRDGSKASNIIRAAKKYGLIAKGYKKEIEQIANIKMPAIIFWNFNHFITLEGISNNVVYINDPASGPRKINIEEFDEGFTGIVLTFEKNENFKPSGKNPSMFISLKSRLAGSCGALLFCVLTGLLLVIPGILIPAFSKIFIDSFLINKYNDWLMRLLFIMILTAIIQGSLIWIQQAFLLQLEKKLSIQQTGRFFWHILRLPIEFFSQRYSGEISSRVIINDKIASVLSGQLASTVISFFTVIFFAAILFKYDIIMTIIGIAIAGINLLVMHFISRLRKDKSKKMIMESGKLTGVTVSGLQSIETLKATGGESDFFEKWAGYYAKMINSQQELFSITLPLTAIPTFLIFLNTAAIYGIGAYRVIDGQISIGMLIAFQALMTSFILPFNQIVNLGNTVQELEGDMNRIDDVLSSKPDSYITDNLKNSAEFLLDFTKLKGGLELKNITFGYNILEPPLIQDFSLKLKSGQRIALVGGSGSGKSTIAKIICGLYQPWSGEIHFDEILNKKIPAEILANSISFVDQDICLFEGTLRENLTLWDSTIPEYNIIAATKDAEIHNDISVRINGYDAQVAEMGFNFSGGQRQRIEIARALVTNPALIIFDEATSSLDPISEKLIEDNLRCRGLSAVIVAHRLSAIRDCDEIIVMDNGKIVQRGTHEELIIQEGLYKNLIRNY